MHQSVRPKLFSIDHPAVPKYCEAIEKLVLLVEKADLHREYWAESSAFQLDFPSAFFSYIF